jgi:hypothetical protein
MTLDKLKIGESATIKGFSDDYISCKLMEMGCTSLILNIFIQI